MTTMHEVEEHIRAVGEDCPEVEWIASPFDTWHRNPHYTGVHHVDPETAGEMQEYASEQGHELTEKELRVKESIPSKSDDVDDDICF